MPKVQTTRKKHQAGQGPLASRDATHKTLPGPRGSKPRASRSQNQASEQSIRTIRLQKSTNCRSKGVIDLTGDGSDSPADRDQSLNVKTQHQTSTKKKRIRSDEHLTNQPSTSTLTSPSPTPGGAIYSISGMATFDQTASPSARPTKRARCEDAIDTDREANIPSVENYYMAPPKISVLGLRSATGLDDLGAQYNCVQDNVQSQDLKNTDAYHQLEANPNKSTPTETIPIKSFLPAYSNEGETLVQSLPKTTDCKVMSEREQKAEVKPIPTQQKPKSLPTLMEKINSAREFSVALGLSERDAYQQLMTHDWVVDQAVLAYLSGAERTKGEDADAVVGDVEDKALNGNTSPRP